MYERRTYAGSDEIILKVTADGHMAGRGIHGAGRQAAADRSDRSRRPMTIAAHRHRQGRQVRLHDAAQRPHPPLISWRDNETKPGKSYYYLRVFQQDTEKPDGDPEIAWGSPFYVTYQ